MKITMYRTELSENFHNVLVSEKSFNYPVEVLNTPQIVTDMLNSLLGLNKQAEEHVYLITVNNKARPLGLFEISHGTATLSLCSPREVFIRALLCGATGIILAHNHPSQDIMPSKADIEAYNRLKEAGKLIGIELLDNIIVGNGYYSFHEKAL